MTKIGRAALSRAGRGSGAASRGGSRGTAKTRVKGGAKKETKAGKRKEADKDMFDSYARLDIHETMLRDVPRTDAYRRAIISGKRDHFQGKTVLDVGCGTGILSLFAAKLGGAKRVYAVEACAETAKRARRIVAANGMSKVVKVICGTIEEIKLPSKVDTILSEWMGYFLVHESMLDSVLVARDRFLRSGGAMYPSSTRLLAGPGDFRNQIDERCDYWSKDVYGFDFSTLRCEAEANLRAASPLCDYFQPKQLLCKKPCIVAEWDLLTCSRREVHLAEASFETRASKASVVNGFAVWFDVIFPTQPAVVLGTGPGDPRTHWGQSMSLVDHELQLKKGEGVDWTVRIAANTDNHRFYDLSFEYGPL